MAQPFDPKETIPIEIPSSAVKTTERSAVESVPTIVGERYAIERELGRGGMAIVYLAHDQKLHNKAVVIKVLLENYLRDEWTVRKFQQEKEALARVDHPGVVGILDTGELTDGKPYLVMQYVEGRTLRDVLIQNPEGIEFERASSIIRQIGEALSAVHEKKIFHRDLKPENIILTTRSRGEEQVRIVDFGIAKVKDSLIAPSTRTGTVTAGTIVYMSPEQLRGEKVSARSDIYSFGVIAYELVTGLRPFRPESVADLAGMQREGVRVKPGDLRPRLAKQPEEMILNALRFAPETRPQDAAEFGEALAGALMTEPKSTRGERQEAVEAPRPKRRVRWQVIAAAATAAIVAGIIGGVWRMTRTENAGVSHSQLNAANTGGQSSPKPILSATVAGTTYTIVSSSREPYSTTEALLTLTVKLSTGDAAVNYSHDLFRLEVDGMRLAPQSGISNEWVTEHSDRKEDVKFIVPNDAKEVRLIVGQAGTPRTASMPLHWDAIPMKGQ